VNLVRALERITIRTQKKMSVYGLFIDFSNAYNSIPHALLFKKLREKKVLEDDEVEFLAIQVKGLERQEFVATKELYKDQ